MPLDTKRALADAFFELCKTAPSIKQIKPKDVTDCCNVSRQTFYNYFHDKDEIVEYIWCSRMGVSLDEFDDYEAWSRRACQETERNWWFYKKAIKDTNFWAWHENWMHDNMSAYIIKKYGEEAFTFEVREALHSWVVGAFRAFPETKAKNSEVANLDFALMYYRNMPTILQQFFPRSGASDKGEA